MSDNAAREQGYTRGIVATATDHEMYLLVKPDTDLDDTFRAWDVDAQEYIRVNGWLYAVE